MVPPPDPCVHCGADGNEIQDGYCGTCGHKQPHPRDHLEIDLGAAALVSDKGKRHHLNEDAMAATLTNAGLVIVVCDGVSSTVAPETASQAAAEAAATSLTAALADTLEPHAAMAAATAAAQRAVIDTPATQGLSTQGQGDPASCTFVGLTAPMPTGDDANRPVTVGWLGDSRAYLVSDGVVTQLTSDDSWAKQQVEAGALTAAEAEGDPRAHSITRWLGEDAIDVEPRTNATMAKPGDLVIVCSDGLWNYATTETELADVIALSHADNSRSDAGTPDSALGLAQRLVAFALDGGGHDNVTVAVASL